MAGDWIKLEKSLPRKPEVFRIAKFVGQNRHEVVGRLSDVWAWLDEHSIDGKNLPMTFADVNEIAGCPNFAEAMKDAKWLSGEDGCLEFPNFERHNGNSAKARALESEAKRLRRLSNLSDKCPTKDSEIVGPEKRREDSNRERKAPTLDEVLAYAKSKEIPEETATSFWRHFEGQGWVTKDGLPVIHWMPKLDDRHYNVVRHNLKTAANGKAVHSAPSVNSVHQADSVIRECMAAIQNCYRQKQYDGPPMREIIPEKAEEYKILKAKVEEMRKLKLGLTEVKAA